MKGTDAAYVAGLFEGEGSVGAYLSGRDRTPRLMVKVKMTDREPLELAQRLTGMGKLYGPYNYGDRGYNNLVKRPATTKSYWVWAVHPSEAAALFKAIHPWLSPRRIEQWETALKVAPYNGPLPRGRRPWATKKAA